MYKKKCIFYFVLILNTFFISPVVGSGSDVAKVGIATGNYAKGCAPNSCSIKGNILTCTDCAKVASSLDFTKCSTRRVEVGVGGRLVCANPDGGLNMGETVAAYRGAGKEFPPLGNYLASCRPNSCSIKGNILTCTSLTGVATSLDFTKCSTHRVEIGDGELVCATANGGLNIDDTIAAYQGAGKEFNWEDYEI